MAATAAKAVATATKASKPAARTGAGKSPAKAGGEAQGAPFGKAEEMAAYREMLLIRRFEEKAGQM